MMQNVDIESVLTTWIKTATGGVRCVTELPSNLSAVVPIIEVVRIGGADNTIAIDTATVDIVCYGGNRINARALAYRVNGLLRTTAAGAVVAGGVILHARTVSGPQWLPYDDLNVRRFGATYQITSQSTT